MKKKILFLAFVLTASLSAQTTTYVGTIKDLTGATVTSGRVTWQLNAPLSTLPGTGAFVSNTVSCLINASGVPKSATDGTSPCIITNNTALTPTGTSYTLCIQPQYVTPGSCITTYATGGTIDITSLVPTPTTQPSYGVASVNATNTWAAKQTFSAGAYIAAGLSADSATIGSLNGVLNAAACGTSTPPAWCAGSEMGGWINAAIAATAGTVYVPPGSYSLTVPIVFKSNMTLILDNATLTNTGPSAACFSATNAVMCGVGVSHVWIMGSGNATITRSTPDTTQLDGLDCWQCSDLHIVGMTVTGFHNGYGSGLYTAAGLYVDQSTYSNNATYASTAAVAGILCGYNLPSNGACSDVYITRSTFTSNGFSSLGQGVYISGHSGFGFPDNIHIAHNKFLSNAGAGFQVNTGGTRLFTDHNYFKSNGHWGMAIVGATDFTSTADKIYTTGTADASPNQAGIYINGSTVYPSTTTTITDLDCEGVTTGTGTNGDCVLSAPSGDITIKGGTMTGASRYGVAIIGVLNLPEHAVITGVHAWNNGADGIRVTGLDAWPIIGAVISGNESYNNGQTVANSTGMFLTDLQNSTVTGNADFDDQSVHTQFYGIASAGTVTKNNIVGHNTSVGNTSGNNFIDRGINVDPYTGHYFTNVFPSSASFAWSVGDRVYNTGPGPLGWVNTVAGSPGTWASIPSTPAATTNGDLVSFSGTTGQQADSGLAASAIPQKVAICGTTTTCANTAQTSPRIVIGTVTLSTGSAVVGSMTAFSSTTSFVCTGVDQTTAAAVKIVNTSTSSITITGTGTDVIAYQCTGN